jgi:hypothetical protein
MYKNNEGVEIMKNITKKLMIYSMVGMMQMGLGAAAIEASPLHTDGSPKIVQLDDRHDRERHENERHQREMRRHDHESDRDWHDRQERENQQHDNTMNEIAAGVVGFVLGSAIN